MVRGSGKFKTKRGGGRSFSKHLELNENGTAVAVDKWGVREKDKDDDDEDDSDEDDEDESEEEDSEEEAPSASTGPQQEMTRAERRAMKASQKKKPQGAKDGEDEDDDDPILQNPNHTAGKQLKLSEINEPRELSRREREAKDKKDAQERYWKLHEQGKTDQAKSDMARLAKIRAEREAAAAKRKAEAEAKAAEVEAKRTPNGKRA